MPRSNQLSTHVEPDSCHPLDTKLISMSVQAAEGNVRCAYKIHVYSDTGNAADGDAATQLNVETRQQLQKEHQRTKVMAHLKQVAWDSEMKNALQWTEIYDEQQQHQKWKKTV